MCPFVAYDITLIDVILSYTKLFDAHNLFNYISDILYRKYFNRINNFVSILSVVHFCNYCDANDT